MKKILLHSCCAPCSAAIIEWLQNNNYEFSIFFFNPNIYPEEEYLIRKREIINYANNLNIPVIDEDNYIFDNGNQLNWEERHQWWNTQVCGLENEPERGKRCLQCFKTRMVATAKYASEHNFDKITTTLASSRWKDINQVFEAGQYAASLFPNVEFWDKNWRKGGLYERRNTLAKQFYNQKYCGCEYSLTASETFHKA